MAALSAALGSPFEVTGAAHDAEAGVTLLRLEGFGRRSRGGRSGWRTCCGAWGAAEVDGRADPWAAIRDVAAFAGRPGDVWRLSRAALADGRGAGPRGRAQACSTGAAGGSGCWCPRGPTCAGGSAAAGARAVLVRAAPETRAALGTFPPEAPGVAMLSARLRERFDPRGLFNPGLMAARAA